MPVGTEMRNDPCWAPPLKLGGVARALRGCGRFRCKLSLGESAHWFAELRRWSPVMEE